MDDKKPNKQRLVTVAIGIALLTTSITTFYTFSSLAESGSTMENLVTAPPCEGDGYSNIDAMQCYMEKEGESKKKIEESLKNIYTNTKSSWGDDADKEIKERIKLSQEGWEIYTINHCQFFYRNNATTHPPSQSVNIARCRYLRSKSRLQEINSVYSNF